MNLQILPVDRAFYDEKLDYLPARMLDIHTHVWLRDHRQPATVVRRGPTWPGRVADQNPIDDLLETYRLMLPKQTVTPVIFGPGHAGIRSGCQQSVRQRGGRAARLAQLSGHAAGLDRSGA